MIEVTLKQLKEMARYKNIPLKKSYRKKDYIRVLGLEKTHNEARFLTNNIRIKAVDLLTQETLNFESKNKAAEYFFCSEGTIRNKIINNGFLLYGQKTYHIFEV